MTARHFVALQSFPAVIDTARLVIRSADPQAAPAVNAAIHESYDALHAWLPWADHVPSVEETRSHMERARAAFEQGTDHSLHMWDRATTGYIGAIGLHDRLGHPSRREVGYWVRTAATGRGYANEAVDAIAKTAFATLGLSALEIHTSERNIPSQRVALRAGFTLMAVREDGRVDPDGTPSASHVYERSSTLPRKP